MGILGWHQYPDGSSPPLLNVPGTESWATETSRGEWSGMGDVGWPGALWTHSQLYDAVVNKDASSWSYYMFGGDGNGGLMAISGSTIDSTAKRFWWVAHYSKFVRPGWVRIGTSTNLIAGGARISAFKDPASGRFAVVVGNEGTSKPGPTITVTCDGFAPRKISAYLTPGEDQNAHLQGPTDVPIVNGKFTYTVPNVSIVTLVGETQAAGTNHVLAAQLLTCVTAVRVPSGLRVVMDQPVRGRAELLDSQGRIIAQWKLAAREVQTLHAVHPVGAGVHLLRVQPDGRACACTIVLN